MADTRETPGTGDTSSEVDGTLVRVLDGELSGPAEDEAQVLLDSSLDARLRLEELWINSDLLSEQLKDLQIPQTPEPEFLFEATVPTSEPGIEVQQGPVDFAARKIEVLDTSRRRLFTIPTITLRQRLAAGIVLLLLSIGLITPLRAWIVEGARSLVSVLAPAEEPADSAPEAEVGSSTVSFVPVGNEFLVTVEAYQASGRLTVVVVEGPQAYGEILGRDAGVELLILPAGIEVRNGSGSTAEYTIGIPLSVVRFRVRVGGRDLEIHALDDTEVGHSWVFELSDPQG